MAGLLLPLLLLVGGYIWYEKFGGKSTIDGIFNEIKSVGGGGGSQTNTGTNINNGSFQDLIDKAQSRQGSWTDENNNNFNVQKDSNSQSNTGSSGNISQKRSNVQKSNVFFTIPRFGNL